MKNKLYGAVFLIITFFSCNSPEQNTAVGNTEDSVSINKSSPLVDTSRNEGPGTDNTGGTSGSGIVNDSVKVKKGNLADSSRKSK